MVMQANATRQDATQVCSFSRKKKERIKKLDHICLNKIRQQKYKHDKNFDDSKYSTRRIKLPFGSHYQISNPLSHNTTKESNTAI
jgi:hypothetical protein